MSDNSVYINRESPYRRLAEKSRSMVDSDSNWLITLSDLFSLLLVFFMMFFVMSKHPPGAQKSMKSRANAQAVAAPAQLAEAVREEIKERVASEIRGLSMEDDVSVRTVNKEIIITMKEKVTFMPGQAGILKSSEPLLQHIASVIEKYPAYLVEIEGNTDNVPINTSLYPSNWELSAGRAMSVLRYFIDGQGIAPSRLSVKGNADQNALAPNDTPENRSKNRRVEIRLREKNP